jgi:hypothetical protein
MITDHDKRLAEEAAVEPGAQISVPAKPTSASALETSAPLQHGTAGDGPDNLSPALSKFPTVGNLPIAEQLRKLRELLALDQQLVSLRVQDIVRAQHRAGYPDHSDLLTGLRRLADATSEFSKLILQTEFTVQLQTPYAKKQSS